MAVAVCVWLPEERAEAMTESTRNKGGEGATGITLSSFFLFCFLLFIDVLKPTHTTKSLTTALTFSTDSCDRKREERGRKSPPIVAPKARST